MIAGKDAHDFPAPCVDPNRAAERVHDINRLHRTQFPGPRGKGIRPGGQRSDRTEIDDVSLEFRCERAVQIGNDGGILTPAHKAKLGHARDLGEKAYASRAVNAPVHLRLDQGAEIDGILRPFGFAEPAESRAEGHGLVLQVALAALVADGTVERVVDEQELHHPFSRLADRVGCRQDLRRRAVRTGAKVSHLHGAGRDGLWPPQHLDQAHPAIARDRKALVVTEARDLPPRLLAGLEQGQICVDVQFLAVNADRAKRTHDASSGPRGADLALENGTLTAPLMPPAACGRESDLRVRAGNAGSDPESAMPRRPRARRLCGPPPGRRRQEAGRFP